jgi:hypothetical protein
MSDNDFEVEVEARGRVVYHVRAENASLAEQAALARWRRGDPGDVPGREESELTALRCVPLAEEIRASQDDELIVRFLKERENLILRLSGNLVAASVNDAISAQQAARGLGWYEVDERGESRIDTGRAARALDRLCASKKLACFTRERVRSGERGEVRLYCTPEYLDRLSAALNGSLSPFRTPRRSDKQIS